MDTYSAERDVFGYTILPDKISCRKVIGTATDAQLVLFTPEHVSPPQDAGKSAKTIC